MNSSLALQWKKRPVRSILIIRFRFMGDMVVLSPLVSNLRLHFPDAKIVVFADDNYAETLRYQPDIDEIITFPRAATRKSSYGVRARAWLQIIGKLRAGRFDLVIDLAKGKTTAFFSRATRAPVRIGFIPREGVQWYTKYYTHLMYDREQDGIRCVDHYLQPLVDTLELPVLTRELVLLPREDEKRRVESLMQQHNLHHKAFLLIHPGARAPRKCWVAEHWTKLCNEIGARYNLPIAVIGAPDERELSQRVLDGVSQPNVNFAGELSIGELAYLASQARLFVGNDSGPMHVVSTTGTDIVCLFGPTDERVWQPTSPNHIVLKRPCPCGLHRPKTACDTLGAQCLKSISVEEVFAAAATFLDKSEATENEINGAAEQKQLAESGA